MFKKNYRVDAPSGLLVIPNYENLFVADKRFIGEQEGWEIDFIDKKLNCMWKASNVKLADQFFLDAEIGKGPVPPRMTLKEHKICVMNEYYLRWNYHFNTHLKKHIHGGAGNSPMASFSLYKEDKVTLTIKPEVDGEEGELEEIEHTVRVNYVDLPISLVKHMKYEAKTEDLLISIGYSLEKVLEYFNLDLPIKKEASALVMSRNEKASYYEVKNFKTYFTFCEPKLAVSGLEDTRIMVMVHNIKTNIMYVGKFYFFDFYIHHLKHSDDLTIAHLVDNDRYSWMSQFLEVMCGFQLLSKQPEDEDPYSVSPKVLCFFAESVNGNCVFEMEVFPLPLAADTCMYHYKKESESVHSEIMYSFLRPQQEHTNQMQLDLEKEMKDLFFTPGAVSASCPFIYSIENIDFEKEEFTVKLITNENAENFTVGQKRPAWTINPELWKRTFSFRELQLLHFLPKLTHFFKDDWFRKHCIIECLKNFRQELQSFAYRENKHFTFRVDTTTSENIVLEIQSKLSNSSTRLIFTKQTMASIYSPRGGEVHRVKTGPKQPMLSKQRVSGKISKLTWLNKQQWIEQVSDLCRKFDADRQAFSITNAASFVWKQLVSSTTAKMTVQQFQEQLSYIPIVLHGTNDDGRVWKYTLSWTLDWKEVVEQFIASASSISAIQTQVDFFEMLFTSSHLLYERHLHSSQVNLLFPNDKKVCALAEETLLLPSTEENEKQNKQSSLDKDEFEFHVEHVGFFTPRITLVNHTTEQCWSIIIDETERLKTFINKSVEYLEKPDENQKIRNFFFLESVFPNKKPTVNQCIQILKSCLLFKQAADSHAPILNYELIEEENEQGKVYYRLILISRFNASLHLEYVLQLDTNPVLVSSGSRFDLLETPFKSHVQQEAVLMTMPKYVSTTGSCYMKLMEQFPWIKIAARTCIERIKTPSEILGGYTESSFAFVRKNNRLSYDPIAPVKYEPCEMEEDPLLASDKQLVIGFELTRGIYEIGFDYVANMNVMRMRKPILQPYFDPLLQKNRNMVVGDEKPIRIYVQDQVFFAYCIRGVENLSIMNITVEEAIAEMIAYYPVAAVVRKIA